MPQEVLAHRVGAQHYVVLRDVPALARHVMHYLLQLKYTGIPYPMHCRSSSGDNASPLMRTSPLHVPPAVDLRPAITSSSVVFPAPLGPSSANMEDGTVADTPRNTGFGREHRVGWMVNRTS